VDELQECAVFLGITGQKEHARADFCGQKQQGRLNYAEVKNDRHEQAKVILR
jgi:hypothetical protein